MERVEILIHHASQVIACTSPQDPKRGVAMKDVDLMEDAALAIADGKIIDLGDSKELRGKYNAVQEIDASGRTVCPGLVDPHTHVVYAGQRIDEFEKRIQGQSYLDIMAAGGGIASTVKAVRRASLEQLIVESRSRLDAMWALGTTTAEVKSGYGLETPSELRMLQAIARLDQEHPIDLVPTFLAAHAVPPEYDRQTNSYIDLINLEMLPLVLDWYRNSHFAANHIPLFADVFCEQKAFDVDQSRRVLMAAQTAGLPLKAHVDEFTELGGLEMAIDLGAVSVDHLDVTGEEGIARLAASTTIGIVIPTVNFHLGSSHFARARKMIDAGAAIALTTDINPGSAPCPSMPLAMAIACRYQGLLPSEALVAGTINAAYAIGLGKKIGSLEIGKQADVLILDIPDYRYLAYQFGGNPVAAIIKNGKWKTNV
jgi:imidazolonepropionase